VVFRETTTSKSGYAEFYLLGHNAMYSVESQPTFRRNLSPPSSGSKNKLSKKPEKRWQAQTEDGGDMFLRNVG
jgi:hypothetical protein